MKQITLYVAVELDGETFDDLVEMVVDIPKWFTHDLEKLVMETEALGLNLTEDILEERIPELKIFLENYVDEHMPDEISPDEEMGESIDDYSWSIDWTDNIANCLE